MAVNFIDLGLADFESAQEKQKEVFFSVKQGLTGQSVIFCRHHPVITLGRLADKRDILISEKQLKDKGIQLFKIERGGQVTYHGPGQLISWPIFDLHFFKKDIHFYLRFLEKIIIDLLFDFGINAETKKGFTGVWIGSKKIASIGIAIKNWISFYGLSLNVKQDDLANFQFIRPCGLDVQMTCLEKELKMPIEITEVTKKLMQKFKEVR